MTERNPNIIVPQTENQAIQNILEEFADAIGDQEKIDQIAHKMGLVMAQAITRMMGSLPEDQRRQITEQLTRNLPRTFGSAIAVSIAQSLINSLAHILENISTYFPNITGTVDQMSGDFTLTGVYYGDQNGNGGEGGGT